MQNLPLRGQELPGPLLEIVLNHIHAGVPSDTICSVLGLKPEVVQQFIDNDPKQIMRLVEVIRKKSRKFRCTQSDRLMVFPVAAPDGDYYDESSLKEHPSLSLELIVPNPRLKAKIAKFCKKSLTRLEVHLNKKSLPDDFFEVIAECLSVLDFEDAIIGMVLSAVQEQSIQQLALKLRNFLPEKRLVSMINQAAESRPSFALCFTKLCILEPISKRASQDTIMCLTEMLRQPALSKRAFELVQEVSGRLNSQHFDWMIQALKAQSVEIRQKPQLLKLKTENRTLTARLAEAEHQQHTAPHQLLHHELAPPLHEQALPTFIYSYEFDTDQLHRTDLVTGEQSSHTVPQHTFNYGCSLNELPGGSILITGGLEMSGRLVVLSKKVVLIEVQRGFAVSDKECMWYARRNHAAVHHAQYVYALGGFITSNSRSNQNTWLGNLCERYVCAEDRWEVLPRMPRACQLVSAIVLADSLFTLGGFDWMSNTDWIQRLSLDSLTWELMEVKLPTSGRGIPCFKVCDTKVLLVINKSLYSFTPLEIQLLRALNMHEDIRCYGASLYSKGTLYCSNFQGAATRIEIGELS
jgi:hypothetical protein